ncbi:MAG: 30S ribosomal protein S21 [Phycisphaerales bacterium]
MAIKVKARGGETVEQMVRRFKKLCEKEGLTKEVKRRQYYEKPSEIKRRSVRRGGPRPMMARGGGASGGGRSGGRSGGGSRGGNY